MCSLLNEIKKKKKTLQIINIQTKYMLTCLEIEYHFLPYLKLCNIYIYFFSVFRFYYSFIYENCLKLLRLHQNKHSIFKVMKRFTNINMLIFLIILSWRIKQILRKAISCYNKLISLYLRDIDSGV